jgi:uncharacterized protein involved in exopolysaccharide biosynthesis
MSLHSETVARVPVDTSVELPEETETTLGEQIRALWARKWRIAAATILGAALAVAAAFLVTPKYQASVLLMPVSESGAGGGLGEFGSVSSQFGGLAALAGLKLGGQGRTEEALAVLQSQALTEMYIQQNHLLPVLFSGRWNSSTRSWKDARPDKQPTLWQANRFFEKSVRQVSTNSKTGLVTLSITWTSAALAADWANGLVKMTNDYMRQRAIEEAERDIAYLNGEAAKTNVVEVRQGIYAILLQVINREMIARGSQEYALKVIDPAQAPEKPSFPHKLTWLLVGAFLGLLASASAVLISADRER